MPKGSYFTYIFGIIIFFIIIFFLFEFLYRTMWYKNYLKSCKDSDGFCGIQIINASLPDKFIQPLLNISKREGKHIRIPKKSQKNISSDIILKYIPELDEQYKQYASIISNYVGETVKPLKTNMKNRITLVVYEKEGDYIDWHFDTNHFDGRYFNLIIPITLEPTCGNYQYKNMYDVDTDVEIGKGQAILFEGDKVFHRGKMLCKDQFRVILSLTYVTSDYMNPWNYVMNKIKQLGVYGTM
jgi:hypothetical protein